MIEYIPAGEAWRSLVPDFKGSDLYSVSSHSSVPSAPELNLSANEKDSPLNPSVDAEYYPRLSTMVPNRDPNEQPSQDCNLRERTAPRSPGKSSSSIATQTANEADIPLPSKKPFPSDNSAPGYRVLAEAAPPSQPNQSDYDQLMERFSRLKK